MKLGLLPEIHVWVGLPDQNELLDFATKFLPEQAAKEGLAWRTPPPPDFLWCGPSELPEGVLYKPDLDAIGFILDRISKTNHRYMGGEFAALQNDALLAYFGGDPPGDRSAVAWSPTKPCATCCGRCRG